MRHRTPIAVALCCAALFTGAAQAQVTIKNDGKWRSLVGLGASYASGNSDSARLNIDAEGVKATDAYRWTLNGRVLYGRTNDTTTDELFALGARYDRNIDTRWFGFGQGGFLYDRPANISQRWSAAGGLGYHVIATEQTRWDVYGGLGYSYDSYREPTIVADELRSSYGRTELLFGEESTHRLTDTTSFRQRFVIYPNLSDTGEFRSVFDAGVAVAINKSLSLTVTLGYRYNSDPGTGLEKADTLLVAGVAYRIE